MTVSTMEDQKTRVLYVDDEEHNLTAFKASFRRDYDVLTAKNADEAKELVKNNEIHVIITDQRMPKTTGIDFLASIIDKHPNPIRVLMTGYADIEAVIDAINRGQVFRYISKPWDAEELKKIIDTASEVYNSKKEKNLFVYKASHDLKGPLASMEGLIDLAEEKAKEENGDSREMISRYIKLLGQSVDYMNETLNDLIEFEKIDNIKLNNINVDFKELVEKVLAGLSHIQKYNVITFDVSIQQDDVVFVNDLALIKSILQNLIQNAVKYSDPQKPKAEVKIDIKCTDKESFIIVKDNGIGMSDNVKKNIFKMFFRASTGHEGSGLGLYIVKSGVDKLKGSISVESEEGKGSTFTLHIPNNK